MRKFTLFILLLLAGVLVRPAAFAQRFAILSDIHVTPGNANEPQLKMAVEEINKSDVDAVIVSGDLTNEGSDEQLRNVKSILDGITKPLRVIPGNHENNWSQSAGKTFVELWGSDHFTLRVGRLLVVGTNCGPFMKMGDGHIKQEDLAWLKSTLDAETADGVTRVFNINHYPLNADLDNVEQYNALLQHYPVVLHQNGHYHKWQKYENGDLDCVSVRALDMKDGNYGYTLLSIDLATDSVKVFNKVIGSEPQMMYAFRAAHKPHPEMKPNVHSLTPVEGLDVKCLHSDEASIFTRLAFDAKRIYFGTSTGMVKAIDKHSGKELWSSPTSHSLFSRPSVWKGTLAVPTADKRLLWLDCGTGAVKQENAARGPYVADGAVKKGVLYQGGYKTFEAWDMSRRRLLWHFDDINNYCQASPVVDGNDVVFGAWDTRLRVLDRATGNLRWQWDNGKKANMYSPGNVVPAVTGDRVIIVAPDRHATALRRSDGKVMWRHFDPEVKVRESLGIDARKTMALAKTMDGTVVAIDAKSEDYNELWNIDCGFGYEHAPCIVLEHNGWVVAGSRHGEVAVIDARSKQKVASVKLGTSEINGFELDGHDIYCSLVEGSIFRIRITAKH